MREIDRFHVEFIYVGYLVKMEERKIKMENLDGDFAKWSWE